MIDFFLTYQSVIDHALVFALLAMSQHIVLRAGVFSLGTAAFAAIGGYATAILVTRLGWNAAAAIAAGTALATLVSIVMAFPLSRLRGVFQAVATMALVQVVLTTNLSWVDLTRGALGISGIPKVASTEIIALAMVLAAIFLAIMGRYGLGRAMDVIREDETVAVSLGIRVAYHQRVAMTVSGFLAGLGGALWACNSYTITPQDFGFHLIVTCLAMVVLGGRNSVWGALIGAAVLTTLPEIFRPLADYRDIVQGILVIAVIIYLPRGIADTLIAMAHRRRVKAADAARGRTSAGALVAKGASKA